MTAQNTLKVWYHSVLKTKRSMLKINRKTALTYILELPLLQANAQNLRIRIIRLHIRLNLSLILSHTMPILLFKDLFTALSTPPQRKSSL